MCPIIRVSLRNTQTKGDRGVCRVTIEKLRASFRFTWRIDFHPSFSLSLSSPSQERDTAVKNDATCPRSSQSALIDRESARWQPVTRRQKRSFRVSGENDQRGPLLERCKETEAEREGKIERKARWKGTGAFFKGDTQWWIYIRRLFGDLFFFFLFFSLTSYGV